ncbi:putative F-box/FBD/LRR-repeat protein At4g03220 [Lolium rigidum]|uniref:putative F-box/FBD/LRR-repeat protein At4g03220 n=1 Tax=Lolium rigidum TaxID=89674 RepID=UPI001F5DE20E|nr:putative F-box/FBD/LRR-repeat protein At4g03220 [Lolium rigidum]
MEHLEGETAAEHAELSAGGGCSEDCLSALPDDVLLHILRVLGSTTTAARTSVLSRRWRRLWVLLPDLYFVLGANPDSMRGALAALEAMSDDEAPPLRKLYFFVFSEHASPDSLAAWLPIAARRLTGLLHVIILGDAGEDGRVAFELPCFERATEMKLRLGFLSLTLPPSGVFARLTDLSLDNLHLHGPCGIGEAVSSPRCPSLQRLTVVNAQGLGNFAIHSESLLKIRLEKSCGLQQLTIVAPALKKLTVFYCFAHDSNPSQPVADIAAPQLVSLHWRDAYHPSSVQFGEMAQLELLGATFFLVDEADGYEHNRDCVRLLRHFQDVSTLTLELAYMPEDIEEDLGEHHYLMEDMTRLPYVTFLTLLITAKGHSFGASSFHVLRTCTSIRKLKLIFTSSVDLEAEPACASGCFCDHPPNWKTEELVLNRLQEVEIIYLKGTEHDFALVKRLFSWATALTTMTISFHLLITESMAKEFCQRILGFSKPDICLKFYVYHDFYKKVLYVPED